MNNANFVFAGGGGLFILDGPDEAETLETAENPMESHKIVLKIV